MKSEREIIEGPEATGRLVLEWKDSNEKLDAIEADFMRHSKTLETLSSLLARSRRVNASQSMLSNQLLDQNIAKMPTPERLASLVRDAREELRRFDGLSARKKILGV
jgi:hypothetical protein